jgi:hypothetical protein
MSKVDEDELKLKAAALFNEVINSDLAALAERIDAGAPINFVGTCGEAPLHIAIYKRDDKMIQMLLDAGADIMFVNSNLDTALHVAARMGLSRVVEHLYDGASALNKKRLFLQSRNRDGLMAFHIACMPVRHWELDLTRLYRSWDHKKDPSLDDEEYPLQHGRLACRNFLKEKMDLDIRNKEHDSVTEMVDQNYDFARTAGILRGRDTSNFSSRIFYSTLDYPAKLDKNAWNENDKQFFLGFAPGVRQVMTKLHTADFVGKTAKSGFENASLIQQQHEIILARKFHENVTESAIGQLAEETAVGILEKGSLNCESAGTGRAIEGIFRSEVPSAGKLRHGGDKGVDQVEKRGVVGAQEGLEEEEEEVPMEHQMVYNVEAALAPEERALRMNASELDPRPSGSARLNAIMMDEADEAVQRALEACREELKEENAEAALKKSQYREFMNQRGISHRLHV